MAESVEERVDRLSRELDVMTMPTDEKKSPADVERELDQNMEYQMTTGPDRVLKRKEAFARYGLQPPTSIASPGEQIRHPAVQKALDEVLGK
jgi:hypothetical protein